MKERNLSLLMMETIQAAIKPIDFFSYKKCFYDVGFHDCVTFYISSDSKKIQKNKK